MIIFYKNSTKKILQVNNLLNTFKEKRKKIKMFFKQNKKKA